MNSDESISVKLFSELFQIQCSTVTVTFVDSGIFVSQLDFTEIYSIAFLKGITVKPVSDQYSCKKKLNRCLLSLHFNYTSNFGLRIKSRVLYKQESILFNTGLIVFIICYLKICRNEMPCGLADLVLRS